MKSYSLTAWSTLWMNLTSSQEMSTCLCCVQMTARQQCLVCTQTSWWTCYIGSWHMWLRHRDTPKWDISLFVHIWNLLLVSIAKLSNIRLFVNQLKINMISKYEIVVWYIDIIGYVHRELLSNNFAVNLFSMSTKYCTIEHYSKINLRCNWLIKSYNCICYNITQTMKWCDRGIQIHKIISSVYPFF